MPAIDENITNADKSRSWVTSCKFQAPSTLARNTTSTRSGVNDAINPSSSTPAAWNTPLSGYRRTGHPGTPGDHHAAPGQATTRTRQHHIAGPVGDGEHDLADLAGLADKPIRRRGTPHIKRLDRQRL